MDTIDFEFNILMLWELLKMFFGISYVYYFPMRICCTKSKSSALFKVGLLRRHLLVYFAIIVLKRMNEVPVNLIRLLAMEYYPFNNWFGTNLKNGFMDHSSLRVTLFKVIMAKNQLLYYIKKTSIWF